MSYTTGATKVEQKLLMLLERPRSLTIVGNAFFGVTTMRLLISEIYKRCFNVESV
jgi:hypothetical protein